MSLNNVKKSIGWADFTWNPVTGCKRGCSYCYAKRIHARFNKTPFENIVFHQDRLRDPVKEKKPSKIFVGSMSDIDYWSMEQLGNILGVIEQCEHHTFMFLSKDYFPYQLVSWDCYKNCMQGLTIAGNYLPHVFIKMVSKMAEYPRPFLSIEPILGTVYETDYSKFELVIVGTDSSKGAPAPRQSWIDSVRNNVPEEKIYWKENIKKYL